MIAVPRRGVFEMHLRGRSYVADPNTVLFQNADDVFRTSHPGGTGDDTDWIAVDHRAATDAIRPFDPGAADRSSQPFSFNFGPCTPGVYTLMQAAVGEAARGIDADVVRVEELAIAILGKSVSAAFGVRGTPAGGRPGRRVRADTLTAHVDLAEAARSLLAQRFTERLTVTEIARSVHSSPFHLCRVFRRHTGEALHQYLNRLRLRAAADRLESSRGDLARLAGEVGFSSHSHFCDAFRREMKCPPSAWRDQIRSARA